MGCSPGQILLVAAEALDRRESVLSPETTLDVLCRDDGSFDLLLGVAVLVTRPALNYQQTRTDNTLLSPGPGQGCSTVESGSLRRQNIKQSHQKPNSRLSLQGLVVIVHGHGPLRAPSVPQAVHHSVKCATTTLRNARLQFKNNHYNIRRLVVWYQSN